MGPESETHNNNKAVGGQRRRSTIYVQEGRGGWRKAAGKESRTRERENEKNKQTNAAAGSYSPSGPFICMARIILPRTGRKRGK